MPKLFRILIAVFCSFSFLGKATIISDLTDKDFHSEIKKDGTAVVIFHAPWCAQCKKLMLKLPEIESELIKNNASINIFKVDCETLGKTICTEYGVKGYPVIKSFRKGKEYGTFRGKKEIKDIVTFIQMEAAPVVKIIKDLKNLEHVLRAEDRLCLVASLRKRSMLEDVFEELAEKLRRRVCFLCSYTDEQEPWVKLYQKPLLWNQFEENFVQYDGEPEISKLENFITNNSHGLVGIRTFPNKNEFNFPLVTTYYNIDFTINPKRTIYWRNRVLKIAAIYRNKFNFAISSIKEFDDELKYQGIGSVSEDKPIVIANLESNEKFVLSKNFSVDTFHLFLDNILHGNLTPYLKSQEPPKNNNSLVVRVVGSTFYDLVMNNPNDTMVKLFAEWCGHCKKMKSTYIKLAKMMKDERITFVEIDALKNDVPVGYTPNGYPTIYWSTKKNRTSPVRYEGDRSIQDFIKFVAKHASNELQGFDREGRPKTTRTEL